MLLYRISQNVNKDYDTYRMAIVCAENEEAARRMHPSGDVYTQYDWAARKHIAVELIGVPIESIKPGVLCAHFRYG